MKGCDLILLYFHLTLVDISNISGKLTEDEKASLEEVYPISKFSTENIVKVHNKFRRKHVNTPDLEWDPALAEGAQEWAWELAKIDQSKASPGSSEYGENVLRKASYDKKIVVGPRAAFGHWNQDDKSKEFVQMFWDDTRKFGCASAMNRQSRYSYIVCRYSPKGNMGNIGQHVKPKKGSKDISGWGKITEAFLGVTNLADKIVKSAALFAHNYLRELHDVAPLKWNEELAEGAKWWAMNITKNNKLRISEPPFDSNGLPMYGENVYAYHGMSLPSATENAILYWYGEIREFTFNMKNISLDKLPLSFTQIVWDQSTDLGCGVALHKEEKTTYVVCRYWLVGNVGREDQYMRNVKPPLKLVKNNRCSKKICKVLEEDIPKLEDLISADQPEQRKLLHT